MGEQLTWSNKYRLVKIEEDTVDTQVSTFNKADGILYQDNGNRLLQFMTRFLLNVRGELERRGL